MEVDAVPSGMTLVSLMWTSSWLYKEIYQPSHVWKKISLEYMLDDDLACMMMAFRRMQLEKQPTYRAKHNFV